MGRGNVGVIAPVQNGVFTAMDNLGGIMSVLFQLQGKAKRRVFMGSRQQVDSFKRYGTGNGKFHCCRFRALIFKDNVCFKIAIVATNAAGR